MSGFNCKQNVSEYIKIYRTHFEDERGRNSKINKGAVC